MSEMTVRRDLEELSRQGVVRLIHAGAVLAPDGPTGSRSRYSLAEQDVMQAEEKKRIGSKAASLVDPGDVIIIDSGVTTEWLARSLPPGSSITVLCFSLNILVEARRREGCTILCAGGTLHENTLAFESAEGVGLVRRVRANKAFFSAGGVSDTLGVTCVDSSQTDMKRAALASSQSRILLADSGKFGRVTPSWFADLKDFDAIVTDKGISLEYVEILRELGIALHVV